jgi:hypothetical protein
VSASTSRPRNKTAVNIYTELHKERLNTEFQALWDSIKSSTPARDRIGRWNEYVRKCWKNETQVVKDELEKQAEEENEKAQAEWNKKSKFTGSPEDLAE